MASSSGLVAHEALKSGMEEAGEGAADLEVQRAVVPEPLVGSGSTGAFREKGVRVRVPPLRCL